MLDDLLGIASHGMLHAGPAMLAYLLVAMQLTIFSVTLYLQLSQTYRSVDSHPTLAHDVRFWSWPTTAIITRVWVTVQRQHHAHADIAQYPHRPCRVRVAGARDIGALQRLALCTGNRMALSRFCNELADAARPSTRRLMVIAANRQLPDRHV